MTLILPITHEETMNLKGCQCPWTIQ